MMRKIFLMCAVLALPLSLPAWAQEGGATGTAPAEVVLKPEPPGDDHNETYRYLNLFGEVFERTRAEYVDDVTDAQLIEAALSGMLSELDPHSDYMDADAFGDMREEATGEFGGLGIQVTMENGLVKVIAPIDETPAWEAGIQPGDFIVEIDGQPVMGMSLDAAVEKMRGVVGTQVALSIAREGEAAPIDLTLTRATIPIHTVRHRVEGAEQRPGDEVENEAEPSDFAPGRVGYVRIMRFNQKTAGEVAEAMAALKAEIDAPIGYVLDLRSNPGGVLEGAQDVADAFLERGEVVSVRGREAEGATRFNAGPGDLADGLPIVVLINAGTASAAEIVAGALQDHGRAVVLGTRSFGKGSVQTLIPLGPGNGAMRLTTARYYTPSGRSIQAKGIEPDILAEPARIEALEGRAWREADLNGALANPDGEGQDADAAAPKKPLTPAEAEAEAAKVDYQLARAIDLLRALAVYRQTAVAAEPDPEAQPEAEAALAE